MWLALLVSTAGAQALLDVNAATARDLDALPGIGAAKAHALLVWREEIGRCEDVADLAEVPGWGPATLAALRSRITCGDGVPDAAPRPAQDEALEGPALHVDRIDVNRAGVYRLTELPGITLARAQDIVAHRKVHGPFASCAALAALPGIGRATVVLLSDRCTTGPTPRP